MEDGCECGWCSEEGYWRRYLAYKVTIGPQAYVEPEPAKDLGPGRIMPLDHHTYVAAEPTVTADDSIEDVKPTIIALSEKQQHALYIWMYNTYDHCRRFRD
jgi:hypothetical protein